VALPLRQPLVVASRTALAARRGLGTLHFQNRSIRQRSAPGVAVQGCVGDPQQVEQPGDPNTVLPDPHPVDAARKVAGPGSPAGFRRHYNAVISFQLQPSLG